MRHVPAAVLEAYGFSATASVRAIDGGLINQTFEIARDEKPVAVCQRLHDVFAPEVNLDIDAVTTHLTAAGVDTPTLLRARDGRLWVLDSEGRTWRMLEFVTGATVHRVESPDIAREAGALVARFHAALADLDYEFAFARTGVHDTANHQRRLRRVLDASAPTAELDGARKLAGEILSAMEHRPTLPRTRRRITHGDLKISNVLFWELAPPRARCLIDLDTLGYQTIAYELGDALRSWCNPHGENVAAVALDVELLTAAVHGYATAVPRFLDDAEVASIIPGLETVCYELAARFCRDAFEDSYFGWDPARFPSRRMHNMTRARGQLALGRSVTAARAQLEAIVARAFAAA